MSVPYIDIIRWQHICALFSLAHDSIMTRSVFNWHIYHFPRERLHDHWPFLESKEEHRTSALSYNILVSLCIRKTCPYNEYPLEPHFYVAKLGYAGVYLFFLFLLQNIDCGYSLEPPCRGGSNVYPQSMF